MIEYLVCRGSIRKFFRVKSEAEAYAKKIAKEYGSCSIKYKEVGTKQYHHLKDVYRSNV